MNCTNAFRNCGDSAFEEWSIEYTTEPPVETADGPAGDASGGGGGGGGGGAPARARAAGAHAAPAHAAPALAARADAPPQSF